MPPSLEKLIVALDAPMTDILWRGAVGFLFLPNYFKLVDGDAWWPLLASLLVVLFAMRVGAGVVRAVLPFSRATKELWAVVIVMRAAAAPKCDVLGAACSGAAKTAHTRAVSRNTRAPLS